MFLGARTALGLDADAVQTAGAGMLSSFALVLLVPALGDRFALWMLPIAYVAGAASAGLENAYATPSRCSAAGWE